MVGIIDYGVGNLFSLQSSLEAIGQQVFISGDPAKLRQADRLVLPGVGAFGDAVGKLRQTGLDAFVKEAAAKGTPLLGICLGMQLLFSESLEYGCHKGLGLLPGKVVPMEPAGLKIPHIGWNSLRRVGSGKLLSGIQDGDFVYFVHSYHAIGCGDALAAVTDYGMTVTAAVEQGNVMGCQFHPEKSGAVGLAILKTFAEEM